MRRIWRSLCCVRRRLIQINKGPFEKGFYEVRPGGRTFFYFIFFANNLYQAESLDKVMESMVWVGMLFILMMLTGMIGWPILLIRHMRKHVEKVRREHQQAAAKMYKDLPVYFMGFDLFKKQDHLRLSSTDPIYQFSQCDLIINSNSILLIGKTKRFGQTVPVNITILVQAPDLAKKKSMAHLTRISEDHTHLRLQFQSPIYLQPITAVIRKPEEVEFALSLN
ncbi:MAG: hypothetical protein AAF206_06435 [Bacteroidota bacterium]